MANPNIASLTTLNFERDKGDLTTTLATLVSGVATGSVEVIDSIFLANISSTTVRVTVNIGSTALLESGQISGFTTEQISGPIVLEEGDYVTGKASAQSSATYIINKRTES